MSILGSYVEFRWVIDRRGDPHIEDDSGALQMT